MSKATLKGLIAKMIEGGNGVTVAQEGNALQVSYSYSKQMDSKMLAVAQKDQLVVNNGSVVCDVPMKDAEKLVEVVEDMRDYVRSGGVQVKDMEDGGKRVSFDYNKDLVSEMRRLLGANFDKQTGDWIVSPTIKSVNEETKLEETVPNPALVKKDFNPKYPDNKLTYFDRTIDQMRNMVLQMTENKESIKKRAEEIAQDLGVNPGIHYPKPGNSYSGRIIAANGNYAIQQTGDNSCYAKDADGLNTEVFLGYGTQDKTTGAFTPDPKGQTVFMAIHNLSEIGEVFKDQNLRINYDANLHAEIRSAELFAKQQAEFKTLQAVAEKLVDGAVVKNASVKEGNKYSGTVMDATDNMVLLSGGRGTFSVHRKDLLVGAEIKKDAKLEIGYKGGKGHVVDKVRQLEKEQAHTL